MNLTLLRIVQWTIIFWLACVRDGETAKKKGGSGSSRSTNRNKNNDENRKPTFELLGTFDGASYFASMYPASWETANRKCRKMGSLLSIRTEAENKYITTFLGEQDSYGAEVTGFWTSGMYSLKTKNYTWNYDGENITFDGWSEEPWGDNEPRRKPDVNTRVFVFYLEDLLRSEWRTATFVAKKRSICKVEGIQ